MRGTATFSQQKATESSPKAVRMEGRGGQKRGSEVEWVQIIGSLEVEVKAREKS